MSVRDGQLRMVLTMTGNLAALTDSEPEELILHPADSSGMRFVLRSRDDEPWVPLSFGQFGDGTPYIYLSGRVTPRVALAARPRHPCFRAHQRVPGTHESHSVPALRAAELIRRPGCRCGYGGVASLAGGDEPVRAGAGEVVPGAKSLNPATKIGNPRAGPGQRG